MAHECACAGSKTAQILEAIHGTFVIRKDDGSSIMVTKGGQCVAGNDISTTPSGMVVANDADEKRAYMLVHRTLVALIGLSVLTL